MNKRQEKKLHAARMKLVRAFENLTGANVEFDAAMEKLKTVEKVCGVSPDDCTKI